MSTPLELSFERVLIAIDSLPPSSTAADVMAPICGFLSHLSHRLRGAFVVPPSPPSAMRGVRPSASFSEPGGQAGASGNGLVKAKPVSNSNGGGRGSPYRRPEHPAPPLLRAHPEGGHPYHRPIPTYKTFAQTFATADTAPSKVTRVEPGHRKVFLTTAKGKFIVVDPADDNVAYVAYDPVEGMLLCFPEAHPKLPHALEFNPDRKWKGLSDSKMFLHFRPAFSTNNAERIATDKWQTIMKKFRDDNIGSDIQYPSVMHPSNDVAWVSVESIVAQVPRKQWTGDGTFDPSVVYEGLGFESILEPVPLD